MKIIQAKQERAPVFGKATTVGGKSRKSGGVSKHLINKLLQQKRKRDKQRDKDNTRRNFLDALARRTSKGANHDKKK